MRRTLAFFLLACSACTASIDSPPPKELKASSTFALDKLSASYGAFSDGKRLELFVAVLGDGFMLVRDGDSVSADVDGTAVPLTERIEGDKVHYVGELASPPAQPIVTITFTRGAEKVVGKARIAPSFEVKSPPSTAKLGDLVALDLDPRPDLEQWKGILGPQIHHAVEVHGECIDEEKQKKIELCSPSSKEGTCMIEYPLQWDTSKVILKEGSNGCEVEAQLRLESPAPTWEGAFKGSFEGLQHRKWKLTIAK